MGGFGSGASRFRRIAEESKRIDIREFRRRGYLQRPSWFTWSWTCGGEPTGSISVQTEDAAITLRYQLISDEPQSIVERIGLDVRPCRFGGHREYFTCPRCGRYAELLYLARGRFICRRCARVGYAIENLERQWRADRRYRQLETRLNEDGSRPARMRWATYHRLCERLGVYDERSWVGIEKLFRRFGWNVGGTSGG